ncbi:DNA ligase [Spirochaetia bacterium]|nr:DNA ligase [Spirochaetia bacterium]
MINNRLNELEQLIKRYQDSYYNGEAEIPDSDFDSLWDELKKTNPESELLKKVGADSTEGFPKAAHIMPMGSQEKAANGQEFLQWAKKIAPGVFVVQYKLDGASLELQYQKGRLVMAITRGDGSIGDVITANACLMQGVVQDLGIDWSGGVRGEVVMPHGIWAAKYTDKANCRNAANGIMRRKDGVGCEDLQLITYDAAATGREDFFTSETEKVKWLSGLKFYTTETKEFTAAEEVIAYREKISALRATLPFDIDGIVVKDIKTDPEDLKRNRPQRQVAFKFELEQAISTLREVEWSESGATYTPIGIVDAVRLAGTTVRRANLCNPAMIRGMGLKIGSKVIMVKRGEIIPKIEGLYEGVGSTPAAPPPTSEIGIPTVCSCGTALVDEGTRLYCPNEKCPKRLLHRLLKWVNVLDIREAGEKTIQRLFEAGKLRKIADFYKLNAAELADFERMGELSSGKLVRNIMSERKISLAAFIAGFDLDGIGEALLEKAVNSGFNTLEKLRAASAGELAGVSGLGEKFAERIVNGLKEVAADIDDVLKAGIISIAPVVETGALAGFSFCFTGELKTLKRKEAGEKVKNLGGIIKPQIVQGLNYLVTNDPNSGSSKNKKAQELGIKIIDEETFLKML